MQPTKTAVKTCATCWHFSAYPPELGDHDPEYRDKGLCWRRVFPERKRIDDGCWKHEVNE